eukprot:jgi/Tetstr1/426249/TSEL_016569.t1
MHVCRHATHATSAVREARERLNTATPGRLNVADVHVREREAEVASGSQKENLRNDEWDRYLTDEKKHATRDKYRHLMCYGVFTASTQAALMDAMATLRAENATARDTADANDLLDSAIRAIATCGQDDEDRLTYLRRFKCKKALTGEGRVPECLVDSRFFDTTAAERSNNGVDGLLNAIDDKRLEVRLHQAAKAQAGAQFKGSGSGGNGGGSGGNIHIRPSHKGEGGQEQGQRQDQGQASARQPCGED